MEEENGLREMTKIERDAQRLLQQEGVSKGSTTMAQKRDPGSIGRRLEGKQRLRTNLHGLVMSKKRGVYRYDVTVTGKTDRGREVELTKRVSGAPEIIRRREMCATIFQLVKERHGGYFQGKEWAVYYDQQAILYSLSQFELNDQGTYELTIDQGIPQEWRFQSVAMIIKEVKERLMLGEFPNGGDAVQNLSLEQFLNVASSQHVIFHSKQHVIFPGVGGSSTGNQIYLLNPLQFGFDRQKDYPDVSAGVRLGIGCSKSARFIEGPMNGGGTAMALLVQTKKTPFHKREVVFEKVRQILIRLNRLPADFHVVNRADLQRLDNALKGLFVDTTYNKPFTQRFKIHRIYEKSAREHVFNYNDREITVLDYYAEKYHIELKYPDANLIIRKNSDQRYYPLELCEVSENQKVNEQQQKEAELDRQTMVQKCSMPPDVLLEHNLRLVESLSLDERNNQYMSSADLKFYTTPLLVNARLLAPPSSIDYPNGATQPEPMRGFTWQSRSHYVEPSTCSKWMAYCLNGPPGRQRDSITELNFKRFITEYYLPELRRRGMMFDEPSEILWSQDHNTVGELHELMDRAKERKALFVLVAHMHTDDDAHHALKLYERQKGIITQGLKIGTICRVLEKGQPLTVQNIGAKTNMKLGGLNYTLGGGAEQILERTLYIGFGVNHPAGGLLFGDEESEDGNGVNGANGNGGNGFESVGGYNGGYIDYGGNGMPINGGGNGMPINGGGNGMQVNGENGHGFENGNGGDANGVQKRTPSVIGFSANIGKRPFEFIGDFVYQTPRRDEKVNIIQEIVKHCVEKFSEQRGHLPERLIIYRNGCSEGQFKMILEYEIPLIKHVLKKLASDAKVTVIVSNKLQGVRLFESVINPGAKAGEKNIQPGTVVDTGAVHPSFSEFYLSSARALQGTTRCPKYTLLYDGNRLSMDELENTTYMLCYGHQIVNMPVSLPSPVYIAEEYAKRGRNLYRRITSRDPQDPQKAHEALTMGYRQLTDELSFRNHEVLGVRRVNA